MLPAAAMPLPPVGAVIVGPLLIGAAVLALIGVGALYLTRGGAQSRRIAAAKRRAHGELGGQGEQPPSDPLDTIPLDELRRRAGSQLVAADEAVRSSEQELLFAQAAYGHQQIEVFRRDIDRARELLTESFRLQQQVDHAERDRDPAEDSAAAREASGRDPLKTIVQNCRRIDETLEEHRQEFEDLRSLERDPGPAADQLADQLRRLRARQESAEDRLAELRRDYDPAAFPQYVTNLRRCDEALSAAEAALARAREAAEAARTSEAVVALHQGEESSSDAADLLDSMDQTAGRLADARRGLDAGLAQTEQDIAQARAVRDAGQAPELAGPIAAAEQAAARVRAALDSDSPIDPLELLDSLESAHRELDEPLDAVRDRQARNRRARESLQTELLTARNQVQSSLDFLRSRRHQVGSTARTRMAEAERCLSEARAQEDSEPAEALEAAVQAKQLAVQAAQIAERERAENNLAGGMGYGGFGGGAGGMGGMGGMSSGRDFGAPGGIDGVFGSPRGRRRRDRRF